MIAENPGNFGQRVLAPDLQGNKKQPAMTGPGADGFGSVQDTHAAGSDADPHAVRQASQHAGAGISRTRIPGFLGPGPGDPPIDMNPLPTPPHSSVLKIDRLQIARNWLPRYTGMPLGNFGDYILLTNFHNYVESFANRFGCNVYGAGRPMQAATNNQGLSMINFGMGSANAATVMDLLIACKPKGVLFLGKCGALKATTEIGHFILPIAAIRGEGTSLDYFPPEVPALPSFKLHKFVSDRIVERGLEYRTGVVYTTNRRLWEHDDEFRQRLRRMTCVGIEMETATLFIVGHYNEIARGALLLVSDIPLTPDGVKTEESDAAVSVKWSEVHLEIGIDAMTEIGKRGEPIRHFH
jgi:AMP nucleosidase